MARRTIPKKIEPPIAGLPAIVTPVPAESYWSKGVHAQLIHVAMGQDRPIGLDDCMSAGPPIASWGPSSGGVVMCHFRRMLRCKVPLRRSPTYRFHSAIEKSGMLSREPGKSPLFMPFMNATTQNAADQALSRVREYNRVIQGLSRMGPDGLPPERLTQHVAAQVSRVTHIEHTKVLRFRPEKGDLFLEAGVGWKANVVGHVSLAADYQSPAGRAFQTAAPVAIRDGSEAKEFRFPGLLRDHGIVSLLNVPIMLNGTTWGVLEVDSTRSFSFDEWDVNFLSTIANVMGVCIALYNANQRHMDAIGENARSRAFFDTVLRELQHRIKNNLQIIIGFLLQNIRDYSSEVQEMLKSVAGRIQSVALAHDLLSITTEASSVYFDDYIRLLCNNLPHRTDVTIEIEAEHVSIPIDRAIPAGIVVNELVTNSLKYAFANSAGHIRVNFALIGNASEACVAVQDDGAGIALPLKKGLGLTLIEKLADQIQGRIEYAPIKIGTRTVLCFPVAV
jgi:two-component sensor histidine kinase